MQPYFHVAYHIPRPTAWRQLFMIHAFVLNQLRIPLVVKYCKNDYECNFISVIVSWWVTRQWYTSKLSLNKIKCKAISCVQIYKLYDADHNYWGISQTSVSHQHTSYKWWCAELDPVWFFAEMKSCIFLNPIHCQTASYFWSLSRFILLFGFPLNPCLWYITSI